MAVQIPIDERLYKRLESIAQKQGTEVNELIQNMVEDYVEHQSESERFRAEVRQAIEKHAELLAKLAKS